MSQAATDSQGNMCVYTIPNMHLYPTHTLEAFTSQVSHTVGCSTQGYTIGLHYRAASHKGAAESTHDFLGGSGVEESDFTARGQGRRAVVQLTQQISHQDSIPPSQNQQLLHTQQQLLKVKNSQQHCISQTGSDTSMENRSCTSTADVARETMSM